MQCVEQMMKESERSSGDHSHLGELHQHLNVHGLLMVRAMAISRMPDEIDACTSREIGVGDFIPTTSIDKPIHITGMDATIRVDTLNHRDMPIAAGPLHIGHEHHNRGGMRHFSIIPPTRLRSRLSIAKTGKT